MNRLHFVNERWSRVASRGLEYSPMHPSWVLLRWKRGRFFRTVYLSVAWRGRPALLFGLKRQLVRKESGE